MTLIILTVLICSLSMGYCVIISFYFVLAVSNIFTQFSKIVKTLAYRFFCFKTFYVFLNTVYTNLFTSEGCYVII